MENRTPGRRLAISGYETVMEGADMRVVLLTLAAGEACRGTIIRRSPTVSSA